MEDNVLPPQRPVALIPAYKPELAIVDITKSLAASGVFLAVVVVNDGSGAPWQHVFDELEGIQDVTVIRHYVNLGKGSALKSGLNHIGCHYPHSVGAVTLDADGQHLAADVLRVALRLGKVPDQLIIGARDFGPGIPLRSRFGNLVTRRVMQFLGGLKLQDTQSGLRGIPLQFFPALLSLRTSGYDFELDMLLAAKQQHITIGEVPIRTVYIDENKSSHFNPLLDSLKIYMVFLRYNLSSLIAVLIDYSVFTAAYPFTNNILYSQFVARAFAGGAVFFFNRNIVFKSKKRLSTSMALYVASVALMAIISYGIIELILRNFAMPVIVAKALAEASLYLIGFYIQREIVFHTGPSNL